MVKVGINGFGRIGRMVFRAGITDPEIEFVAVNDLTDTKTLAHLLKYDSIHGRFKGDVGYDQENLIVNGKKIRVFSEKEPEKLPWGQIGVEVVVESTGFFTNRASCEKHLTAGAKKVILSAPSKEKGDAKPILTLVMGVNDAAYDGDPIVSNASCTTNCLAPVAKVLHEKFGIKRGFMTTVHSYTADQKLVDAPHKDLRRARSGALSQIPTTTGAAKAVGLVIPELNGKLDGISIRVPTPDGSVVDLVFEAGQEVSKEEINAAIKEAAEGSLKGYLEYTEDEIVSCDVIGNTHSSIFDASSTKVMDKNFVKILSWYDNEFGYSCRMIDMIKLVSK